MMTTPRRGRNALLDRPEEPNRYEAALAAADDPTGFAGLLAGASQRVRLRHRSDEDEVLTAVVCGVAAPTLVSFAVWIAGEASRLELDDLVFLSRNGRLPFEVFSRLGAEIIGPSEPRYVRLSRDAVRLASADAVGLDRWLEIGQANRDAFLREFEDRLTLEQIMKRIGLDPSCDGAIVRQHGLDPEQMLTVQNCSRWAHVLDDERIRARLRSEAGRARRELVDYLAANGVSADRRTGVVDIGWTGQQSAMMSACLGTGDGEVHHFHLGRESAVPLLAPTQIHRYLFDIQDNPINNAIGLYELFTSTSEPGMTGLRRLPDGRVEAEFRQVGAGSMNVAFVEPLHRLVAEFVDELRPHLQSVHLQADVRSVLRSLAQKFWFSPTPAEGRLFGAMPWEVDTSGYVVRSFAAPVRGRELVAVVRPGGLAGRQWSVGAIAASRWGIRWLLTQPARWRARRQLAKSQRRRPDERASTPASTD